MATKVKNSYRLSNDITNIYNIYKGRQAAGSDFLQKISGAFDASPDNPGGQAALQNAYQLISKASQAGGARTIGDLFSIEGLNFNYETDAPEGNYMELAKGATVETAAQVEPKDKLTIIGEQDNSLEAFLKTSGTSGSLLGGSSGGGTSGGATSGGGGGRISGGGSSLSGGGTSSLLGGSSSPTGGASAGTSSSAISDIVTQSISEAESQASSSIYKKLKSVSGSGRIDKILTGKNLRQQTLLGK